MPTQKISKLTPCPVTSQLSLPTTMDCAGRSSRFQKIGIRPPEEAHGIAARVLFRWKQDLTEVAPLFVAVEIVDTTPPTEERTS